MKNVILKYPLGLLKSKDLTITEKYLLGLDYMCLDKLGYNCYSNLYISKLLNLNVNTVSKLRRALVKKGVLLKSGKQYRLTSKMLEFEEGQSLEAFLFPHVYANRNLVPGAKLLWAFYNVRTRGEYEYFACREYTATQLGIGVKSVTNWTTQLLNLEFLYIKKKSLSTFKTINVISANFL
ncbi:hypothetical protein [Aegicerativicinus sediminis]|uniref:hypothetical protein n=1 Tax=Aegicerativicinus sediminis TaxID=2893202 RepID=UPI001E641204|nr:hypothetical protein [Aegicerativicinus sediminis]